MTQTRACRSTRTPCAPCSPTTWPTSCWSATRSGAGIAAFEGVFLSAGPGLCALNIDRYVAAAEPSEQESIRAYLERTQRPQGIAALREKWQGDLPASRRRTYVLTTADTLVPPESQRVMAASVGADIVEIDTDHGPFREQPERLAEILVAGSR